MLDCCPDTLRDIVDERYEWAKLILSCRALAIAVPMMAFSSSTQAQQPLPMSPELKAFLTRPEEQRQFGGMMNNVWRSVVENCPSPTARGMNVNVDVPPTFDSAWMPMSGQWTVIGRFEGCGKFRILRVVYQLGPNNRMRRVALLPGTTRSDLRLAQDATLHAVVAMVQIAPKDCKSTKIINTEYIGFDGGKTPPTAELTRTPWAEEWTVRACAIVGVVDMHFVPNSNGIGTTIIAQLNRSKVAKP
ncbi:MAG: hypothetical protein JSR91_03920 [Proteobacteria bacterium]|nr:hypothetical protein [Pseudomonadota bacterium]